MTSFERLPPDSESPGVTCVVVTAGIGMVESIERIEAEMADGSLVRVVATSLAAKWMKAGELLQPIEELTGAPVESDYRTPWDPKPSLMFNRCVVAPLTLNTVTKWADGHPDNLALSMLCEAAWTRGSLSPHT